MSPQAKNYVIVFLACTTLGAATLLVQTRQQLTEARNAPSIEVKRSEFSTTSAPTPINQPAAALPSFDAGPTTEAPAERTEDGPGNRGNRGAQMAAQMAELMKDPEFAAAMKIQQDARIEQRYRDLFKKLNLPPEQLATMKTLLAEREAAGRDVWGPAREEGLNPNDPAVREQLRALTEEFQKEVDTTIASTLGPQVLAELETYRSTTPQRTAANNIGETLAFADQALNSYQSRQFVSLLSATGTVSGRNVLITDATIAQASAFLTSDQIQTIKTIQKRQQAEQLIQAKTRAAREAARTNRGN